METALLTIAWFPTIAACAGLCAFIARWKGRGALPWALAGYMFGPVALLAVAIVRHSSPQRREIIDVRELEALELSAASPVLLLPSTDRRRMKGQRAA